MTLFFRNATPMLELLLIRAAGTSSCSEDHVADDVRSESGYVAKSDKSIEEYINSESTIKGRHAMYWAARFVDEMIICCQKDFYSRFLTRFLVFPMRYVFDTGLGDIFVGANWSKGIWDFRLNKFKRPLECHTAVIGRILKDKDAVFVDL